MSLTVGGNVNDQGVRARRPRRSTVVAGSTVQTQVNYDVAAILQLTMVGGAGGTVPNAMPYTIANTGLLPGGTKRISGAGQTGPNRTLANLYPYLSGYQLWAGSCLDADPQGQKPSPPGGAYYPGKVRDPALGHEPGSDHRREHQHADAAGEREEGRCAPRGRDGHDGARGRRGRGLHHRAELPAHRDDGRRAATSWRPCPSASGPHR